MAPIGTFGIEGLRREHVEDGPAKTARIETVDQRGVVHERAAGDVHEHGVLLHAAEEAGVGEAAGPVVEGAGQHDHVGAGQEIGQVLHAPHLVGEPVGVGPAAHDHDAGVEGARPRRDGLADRAEADDQPDAAGQLAETGLEPLAPGLGRQLFLERLIGVQDLGQDVFRDGHGLGAAVAEADARLHDLPVAPAVETGGHRLHPFHRPRPQRHVEGVVELPGGDEIQAEPERFRFRVLGRDLPAVADIAPVGVDADDVQIEAEVAQTRAHARVGLLVQQNFHRGAKSTNSAWRPRRSRIRMSASRAARAGRPRTGRRE